MTVGSEIADETIIVFRRDVYTLSKIQLDGLGFFSLFSHCLALSFFFLPFVLSLYLATTIDVENKIQLIDNFDYFIHNFICQPILASKYRFNSTNF